MTSTDLNIYPQDPIGDTLDFPQGTSEQAIAALGELKSAALPTAAQGGAASTLAMDPMAAPAAAPAASAARFMPWLVGGSVLALAGAGLLVWLR